MEQSVDLEILLKSPHETSAFARFVGAKLEPGDVLLLSGSIGAGKTHFARSLIQSQLSTPEDVPSPTFTLVQTYETGKGEVWHTDLYRLTDTSELVELGLTEAFEEAICLVEWPDRLGSLTPQDAVSLHFALAEEEGARQLHIQSTSPRWHFLEEFTAA